MVRPEITTMYLMSNTQPGITMAKGAHKLRLIGKLSSPIIATT